MHHVVAVAAVIVRKGRILAMQRARNAEAGAGLWETLSGRVEPGEEPLDAVRREIVEECGLEVEVDARPLDVYAASRNGAPMIVIVYRATHRRGEVLRSHEHDAHAWLTPPEFRERSSLTRLADSIDLAFRG
ncbi:MAG: NUDIX domain-containing protein [Sandaracinaceae bacterium]